MKIAYFSYFEPWDWVIAVSSYEDEYMGTVYRARDMIQRSLQFLGLLVLVASTVGAGCFYFISTRISKEMSLVSESLTACSRESTPSFSSNAVT